MNLTRSARVMPTGGATAQRAAELDAAAAQGRVTKVRIAIP
ncbi:MAG TPA: hypothetical protein VNL96_10510 [Gemmatimonadaceae bacterium]|nr:hypothetical protein [Gemmatimonadaceae bacterium]